MGTGMGDAEPEAPMKFLHNRRFDCDNTQDDYSRPEEEGWMQGSLIPIYTATPKGNDLSGNPTPKVAENFRLRIYNKLPKYKYIYILYHDVN